MDVTVNSGNVNDSVAFDGLYERLIEKNPEIEAVVMDAGYKTPWISKRVLDDKRMPVLPYKDRWLNRTFLNRRAFGFYFLSKENRKRLEQKSYKLQKTKIV